MVRVAMLTTTDNPYDPFDSFDDWYAYDVANDHHSSSLLARLAIVSDALSEADYALAVEQAIDEIILEKVNPLHIKVVREQESKYV